jgi:hypothetical protein
MTNINYDVYVGWGNPPTEYKYEGRYNLPEYSVPKKTDETHVVISVHRAAYPNPKPVYKSEDEEWLSRIENLEIINTGVRNV